jgi:murein DD-endopeptidase MepM/ murein hydrolase activator NlpD
MKREEILLLTGLLLVSSKEAIAIEKTQALDYVKLATFEQDSKAWLIKRVMSLPRVQVEREVKPFVPKAHSSSLGQSKKNRTYTIAPGDTLENLAKKFQTTISQLVSRNGIENPNYIWEGQTLIIPDPTPMTSNSTTKESAYTKANQNLKAPTPPQQEIDVSALVKREKTLSLPPPEPPISPKNFSAAEPKLNPMRSHRVHTRSAPPPPKLSTSPLDASQLAEPISRGKSSLMLRPDVDNRIRPHRPITDGHSNLHKQKMRSRQRPRFELVFVAPTSVPVTPELPPLSVPDDDLPLSPRQFTGYIWPTSGKLTSGYGWRWGRMHKGVDIANAPGTPIWAAAAGEVISSGWNNGGYGNLVKLKHADGSVTLYAHNSRVLVRTGQRVSQGEIIAQMGSTGFSTGSHLHFEIHPSGQGAVNPMAYLPK